ncbi:raftlin [Diretmus argenteus]
MGCRLPKLRKAEERRSPGKIYSTLRRPQVETKVGVAYTYHFLDFLLGKEEVSVSSVLCLSSVRELPVQVRELYAQGFVLVAVHPFVHPCGPRHARIQRQLHRAVLVRETPSAEKSQLRWAGRRLETDVCVAGHQAPDPEAIQNYVKRIQDVAEQGVMFVGFLQQPGGGPCFLGHWDPEELSSLHSSPSPIHRHPFSANASPTDLTEPHDNVVEPGQPRDLDHDRLEPNTGDREPSEPRDPDVSSVKPIQNLVLNSEEPNEQMLNHAPIKEPIESTEHKPQSHGKLGADTVQRCQIQNPVEVQGDQLCPSPPESASIVRQLDCSLPEATKSKPEVTERHFIPDLQNQRGSPDSWVGSPELHHSHGPETTVRCGRVTTHNNNHIQVKSSEKEKKNATSPPTQPRMQLFALYNHTGELKNSLRFYSLRVPLCVQKEAGLATEVDAHWLDHMTQHFTSGAHLIDGFFHLGDDNDNGVSSVDSVFIFQSSAEETTNTAYDAIVVEQWTVVDGVVVKTDYIPLLQSLAPYGWRLMCVLPTPIVKTNSDGSLSTKQILFLQRPILQRKRKDFKMLNLRGRNKAKKNSAGETPETERENTSPVTEREMEKLRRNTKEEGGEGRKSRGNGKSEGTSPQRGGEEAHLQKDFSPLTEGGASDENQEEETEIDRTPLAKREKTVRWTDVCQRDDGGVKEVKAEERIKQQLSERALFSGVC